MEDAQLKRAREDLQNRVDFLRKQAEVSSGCFEFSVLLQFTIFLHCYQ